MWNANRNQNRGGPIVQLRSWEKKVSQNGNHRVHAFDAPCQAIYALAHPQIHFTLKEGGRIIFKSPACDDLKDRVCEIFGKGFAECLAPIENEEGNLVVSGLVAKPGQSRPTRKK